MQHETNVIKKKVQHEKRATRKKYNMEIAKHKISATPKRFNMEIAKHEKRVTRKTAT